jgi:hypothetical protein
MQVAQSPAIRATALFVSRPAESVLVEKSHSRVEFGASTKTRYAQTPSAVPSVARTRRITMANTYELSNT